VNMSVLLLLEFHTSKLKFIVKFFQLTATCGGRSTINQRPMLPPELG